MIYQTERDEFFSILGAEGIRPEVTRALLRESTTLQRLAELECSSEAADRDQVRCPASGKKDTGACLCRDYGSVGVSEMQLSENGPALSRVKHGTVPRHMVKSAASTARVVKLCQAHNLVAHFGGDPRGCMLVVSVPSGRTNDWEQRGIAVPAQGYSAAQMERITR